MSDWIVYVLSSTTRKRTYVGITIDLERRLAQHNGERAGGARATRAGRPWIVAARYGPYESRGDALRAELRVKRLRGEARFCSDEPDQPSKPESISSAGPS
ncbi:MAG: putative GIY-YIG superfamily endonuclease [Myxococcota bacterium]|jgi:predicted GIY-YIG superfamily endonuclease